MSRRASYPPEAVPTIILGIVLVLIGDLISHAAIGTFSLQFRGSEVLSRP
jgi:hypothetical protein